MVNVISEISYISFLDEVEVQVYNEIKFFFFCFFMPLDLIIHKAPLHNMTFIGLALHRMMIILGDENKRRKHTFIISMLWINSSRLKYHTKVK